MNEQHCYRREGLTLAAWRRRLNVGEAALRALINQQLGYRNFNDFLHHYRLQEAAARLAREDLPILTHRARKAATARSARSTARSASDSE